MAPGGLDIQWWWLLAAALLGIMEIVAPGIFLVWLGAAAAITGIVCAVVPIGLPVQLALFGILAIASVMGGKRYYERNPVGSSDPLLNDRTARLIGQNVEVVTPIVSGEGRVKVGDSVWSARGPDAPAGTRVRIVGAQGNCLTVEPVAALPPADAV